ncbi:preprotein translocase subunit SecG [Candidatus Parcubacteria bacterium]|nr:MAG: preprotein translocase subunit SecG [Candidatus Parcubacteria bacterium]
MKLFQYAQLVVSILLITVILLQNRGAGVSGLFGGGGNVYSAKRGLDKTLFRATIVLAVIFLAISIASLLAA